MKRHFWPLPASASSFVVRRGARPRLRLSSQLPCYRLKTVVSYSFVFTIFGRYQRQLRRLLCDVAPGHVSAFLLSFLDLDSKLPFLVFHLLLFISLFKCHRHVAAHILFLHVLSFVVELLAFGHTQLNLYQAGFEV